MYEKEISELPLGLQFRDRIHRVSQAKGPAFEGLSLFKCISNDILQHLVEKLAFSIVF